MPFPILNKTPHHHKPYSSTWTQVSAVLQKLLWKINSNSKAKSQCLKLHKESYHSTSQKEAPSPQKANIHPHTKLHLVSAQTELIIIIFFNAAVFQLNYFL